MSKVIRAIILAAATLVDLLISAWKTELRVSYSLIRFSSNAHEQSFLKFLGGCGFLKFPVHAIRIGADSAACSCPRLPQLEPRASLFATSPHVKRILLENRNISATVFD